MPLERADANQVVQWGKETTPGTGVAANKLLQSIDMMMFAPNVDSKASATPVGQKYPVSAIPGRDWVDGQFNGDLDYQELPYFLAGIMKSITPTGPGAQAEYTWVGLIDRLTQETPQTYSWEHGSAERADKMYFGLITDFEASGNSSDVLFNGKVKARSLQDGATLTASPTSAAIQRMAPAQGKCYLDATAGGIGTTQLTKAFNWKFGISGRWGTPFAIDGTTTYANQVELIPGLSLELTLESDAVGMGLLTDIRAGSKKFIRIEYTGATIGAAVKYKSTLDLACVLDAGPGQFNNEQDVVANTWRFSVAYDATLAKALSWTVINTLVSL